MIPTIEANEQISLTSEWKHMSPNSQKATVTDQHRSQQK